MANLVAIAYDDLGQARQVTGTIGELVKEHSLTVEDVVIVEHKAGGKMKLHQPSMAAGGAAGGALWGGLIGLIFLAPLFGMAIGAASGALGGKMSDVGVNDDFMKQLGAKLPPGGAALIALGRSDAPDRVLERLRPYGGEVIQTSLSEEDEARLRSALGEQVSA